MNLLPSQSQALTKQLPNKVGALFMKMGTGKTRVAIELVNAVNDVDLVVWIAPLRTINPLDDSLPSIKDEVAKWEGFNAPKVVYVGVETIGQSDRQYLQLFNQIRSAWRCFLIVDESIKIKNHEAKRTQRVLELGKMVEYKLILNGEPITRDLLDIWSQFQFLDPSILTMDIGEFKSTFCRYTTITKTSPGRQRSYTKEFITGYENIDYLYSLIGEYVFECDLELNISQIFHTENYQLDDEAKERYQFLKTKYLDNEMLMMLNNNIFLELTMKMQHEYCCTEEKFEKVADWFETYPEAKSIIYCKYIASAEECRRRFPKATVLNYKSGSFSLNLQHLPYTVYFDQTFDWGDVIQSSYRNYRTGQAQDVRYLRLIGNVGLEKLMQENNEKKLNTSDYLKKISRKQLINDL